MQQGLYARAEDFWNVELQKLMFHTHQDPPAIPLTDQKNMVV